jgi:NADH-quinone oxidoreductase subunit J
MIVGSILFFLCTLSVISCVLAVVYKQPIYCMCFLIAFSICINVLLCFLYPEYLFLCSILLIVYVGAIAVFFLFVILMLDLHIAVMLHQFSFYFFSTLLCVGVALFLGSLFTELTSVVLVYSFITSWVVSSIAYGLYNVLMDGIGQLGFILLVGLVGSILLSNVSRGYKQLVYRQLFFLKNGTA